MPAASTDVEVTVILCTRNRGSLLSESADTVIAALRRSRFRAELLIVDNGSTDDTSDVVAELVSGNEGVRSVLEPLPGLGRARNRGMAETKAMVLLFTDDDVHVPLNWVDDMAEPLVSNSADGVTGIILLAPHYEAMQLSRLTKALMARRPEVAEVPQVLVGASMGVRSDAVGPVRFDDALGRAPYEGFEEALFSYQMLEGGARFWGVGTAAVLHHFAPSRLEPDRLVRQMRAYGRAAAYLTHHWSHEDRSWPSLRAMKHVAQLQVRRLRARGRITDEVLELENELAFHQEMRRLARKPRNYALRALSPVTRASAGSP